MNVEHDPETRWRTRLVTANEEEAAKVKVNQTLLILTRGFALKDFEPVVLFK